MSVNTTRLPTALFSCDNPSAPPQGLRSRTMCNVTNLPALIRELMAQALTGQGVGGLGDSGIIRSPSFGSLGIGLNVASI